MRDIRAIRLLLVSAVLAFGMLVVVESLSTPTTGSVAGVLETSAFQGSFPFPGVVTLSRLDTSHSMSLPFGPHKSIVYPRASGTWIPTGADATMVTFSSIEVASLRTYLTGSNGQFSISVAPGTWYATGGGTKSRQGCHGGPVVVHPGKQASLQVLCFQR